jgi:hypothetical protein
MGPRSLAIPIALARLVAFLEGFGRFRAVGALCDAETGPIAVDGFGPRWLPA